MATVAVSIMLTCSCVISVGYSFHLHFHEETSDKRIGNDAVSTLGMRHLMDRLYNSTIETSQLPVKFGKKTSQLIEKNKMISNEVPAGDRPIRHNKHRGKHRSHPIRNNTESTLKTENSSMNIAVVSVGSHTNCYNSNEVLEIIGFTCLVNFAFWSLILTCVHIHTKPTLFKTHSTECMIGYDETPPDDLIEEAGCVDQASTWRNVDRYLESLSTDDFDPDNSCQLPLTQVATGKSRNSMNTFIELVTMDSSQNATTPAQRWRHELKKKQMVSLSMENLLF